MLASTSERVVSTVLLVAACPLIYMVQIQYHVDDRYYCSFALLLPNMGNVFVVSPVSQLSDMQLQTECALVVAGGSVSTWHYFCGGLVELTVFRCLLWKP